MATITTLVPANTGLNAGPGQGQTLFNRIPTLNLQLSPTKFITPIPKPADTEPEKTPAKTIRELEKDFLTKFSSMTDTLNLLICTTNKVLGFAQESSKHVTALQEGVNAHSEQIEKNKSEIETLQIKATEIDVLKTQVATLFTLCEDLAWQNNTNSIIIKQMKIDKEADQIELKKGNLILRGIPENKFPSPNRCSECSSWGPWHKP